MKIVSEGVNHDKRGLAGIKNVSIELNSSTFYFVIGPSGSGKSTLLNLIKSQGAEHVQLIEDFNSSKDQSSIDNSPVWQALPRKARSENERFLLEEFELTGAVEKSLEQLSQGERQRFQLVKELSSTATVLLLDDCLHQLDPLRREHILDFLKSQTQEQSKTVLVVSHDLGLVHQYADEVVFVEHAQIVETGTPAKLYRSPKTLACERFFGGGNLLTGKVVGDRVDFGFDCASIKIDENFSHGLWSLKPQDIHLDLQSSSSMPQTQGPGMTSLMCTISSVVSLGETIKLFCSPHHEGTDQEFQASILNRHDLRVNEGDAALLSFSWDALCFLGRL